MHLDMLYGGNTVETVASVEASKGLPERAMTPTWLLGPEGVCESAYSIGCGSQQ